MINNNYIQLTENLMGIRSGAAQDYLLILGLSPIKVLISHTLWTHALLNLYC